MNTRNNFDINYWEYISLIINYFLFSRLIISNLPLFVLILVLMSDSPWLGLLPLHNYFPTVLFSSFLSNLIPLLAIIILIMAIIVSPLSSAMNRCWRCPPCMRWSSGNGRIARGVGGLTAPKCPSSWKGRTENDWPECCLAMQIRFSTNIILI